MLPVVREAGFLDVRETVFALAERLAEQQGLTLVDVEFVGAPGRSILRCVLDKPGGVTLDDCAGFHRALDPVLDATDPVPGSYVLEVSSPGQERPLKTARDFRLFAGRPVLVAAREAVDGRREWAGRLLGLQGDSVLLAFGEEEGQRVAVPLERIEWARLRMEDGAHSDGGDLVSRRVHRTPG
jgi:ribosome maturation factor RimP